MSNPEIGYQELQLIMASHPEIVELGAGTITRRNSMDFLLYHPMQVHADYKDNFRKGWYSFHDRLGDLLAPGNAPARIIF